MKKFACLLFTLIPGLGCFALADPDNNTLSPYITYNQKYYLNDKFDSDFFGHVGAITGEVIRRETGPNDLPILQIKLDGLNKTLWVASVNHVQLKHLNVGDNVDVLGFFDKSKLETEHVAKLTDDPEYLIGFCIHLKDLGLPIYFDEILDKCLQWEMGQLDMKTLSE